MLSPLSWSWLSYLFWCALLNRDDLDDDVGVDCWLLVYVSRTSASG